MKNYPRFEEVRRDLVATLYGLAHALDMQVRTGAGAALLNLPSTSSLISWPDYDDFSLVGVEVGDGLNTLYRYAFQGELESHSFIGNDPESDNLGRIQALIKIVYGNDILSGWVDEAKSVHNQIDKPCSGLFEMVRHAAARHSLDTKKTIELSDIALLANMNERSVRNALHAEGEAMLAATRGDDKVLVVEQAEALRWLSRRHAFRETKRIGNFGESPVPKSLSGSEIIPFIASRLGEHYSDGVGGFRYSNAGSMVGWPEERVRALVEGRFEDINPDDCPVIARMALVDTGWFTTQVMRARFPDAMKELGPSDSVVRVAPAISLLNEVDNTLDAVLTDAGLRNGYVDIESRYADRFFPADCFGSRGSEQLGVPIALHHSGRKSPYETDLRVKSQALVSPRKRFSAYFTTHNAKAGDVIRFKRTAERTYELTYLPKK